MKKVAFISDIHLDEEFPLQNNVDPRKNWLLLLNDIRSKQINEIIFGGDIGEADSHKWFFDTLKDFKIKVILGNHDSFNAVIKHLPINLPYTSNELYYSEEDDFFKYIYLDSSSDRISDAQLDWFKKELFTSKKIVIFIHHPLLTIDTAVDKLYPLQNRAQVIHLLENCINEVTVFCAHYHMADNREYKNIRQFVVPAASFQVIKEAQDISIDTKNFGYSVLLFNKENVHSEIMMQVSS